MTELTELKTRLGTRLPGRTDNQLGAYLSESLVQHGYTSAGSISTINLTNVIVTYAEYIGLRSRAVATADNSRMSGHGISNDKTGASTNYYREAQLVLAQYRREAIQAGIRPLAGGSIFSGTAVRIDGR